MSGTQGDVLTKSSTKRRKPREVPRSLHLDYVFEEEFGSLSDSGQGAWSLLGENVVSELADSVVSLASFDDENSKFFACTCIIIESGPNFSTCLTSLSLARSIDDDTKVSFYLKIRARLPNNDVATGWLRNYDLCSNVAVVTILMSGLRPACIDHPHQSDSVVAVGRCFHSGKLMATSGILTEKPSGDYRPELMFCTCEITMAGIGGPLIDVDGNFVGMNFYAKGRTPFLPRNKIIEILNQFEKKPNWWVRVDEGGDNATGSSTNQTQETITPDKSDLEGERKTIGNNQERDLGGSSKREILTTCLCDPEGRPELAKDLLRCMPFLPPWPIDFGYGYAETEKNCLTSNGYPYPVVQDFGMRLINNFGDEFGEDISCELTNRVASKMSRSVVALASFSENRRFFACTGIFMDYNQSTTKVLTSASLVRRTSDDKTAHDLEIKVCLPNGKRMEGILQHCNLHYNIAVVSIPGFRCVRTVDIYDQVQVESPLKIVALGRGYKSGKLMATSGKVMNNPSQMLTTSTCKITKAGIGGPLFDFDGNFIGMNFYGLEETPYIPRDIILKCLGHFADGTVASDFVDNTDFVDNNILARWSVPKVYWCYPTWHEIRGENDEPMRNEYA